MSDVVIRAEGLGKKYIIGHESKETHTTFREVLVHQALRLAHTARDMAAGRALIAGDEREDFWALKGVDFEINRGDVVGIIGRNGAGKSTLLKVLSRITEPSEGRVTIQGRIASLLEVGTGFHPELTGRENIFLNGAILGMTQAEIRRKFDAIVDFAGVEKFIDTPVKRYSSGMYVRLAFSVAAHLEPEILIVDEVLAVGDSEFQKKCLGKMQDVAGQGRTVLFVSHNTAAVQVLCNRAIMLSAGKVAAQGPTDKVIDLYLTQCQDDMKGLDDISWVPRKGSGRLRFSRIEFRDENGESVASPRTGQAVDLVCYVDGDAEVRGSASIGLSFHDETGSPLIHLANQVANKGNVVLQSGDVITISIKKFPLFYGRYTLNMFLEIDGQIEDWIVDQIAIDVEDGSFFGTARNAPIGWEGRTVLVDSKWRVENTRSATKERQI